jgi:polysaccharide export outer membrane protein
VAATACGCASSGVTPQYYEAKSLPYELQAKPVENAKTVDLSRLAVAGDMSESIDTDDVLEVTIVAGLGEKDSLTFPMRIQPNGAGNIPGYGPLQLAGLDMPSAEETIAAAIVQRGLYRAPHVTVTMKRQRMNKITVLGGVMKEGVYNLPRKNSNLLAAIVAAGGLADDAGTYVEIRQPASPVNPLPRSAPIAGLPGSGTQAGYTPPFLQGTPAIATGQLKSTRVNLVTAAKEGRGGQTIEDGGVVMIEKRDLTPIQVIGLVHAAGRYEFPVGQDLRILDAIALAKGVSSKLADSVLVTRPQPNGAEPLAVKVSIHDAKRNAAANMLLQPGDVVSVEQTPGTIFLDALQIIRVGVTTSLSPLLF